MDVRGRGGLRPRRTKEPGVRKLDLTSLKFLVVEPNGHMRVLTRQMLKGFRVRDVHEATSVEQAKALCAQHTFDIILMELAIGKESGLAFTHYLRSDPASGHRFTPIVILTGFTQEANVKAAVNAGGTEFLGKPISPATLYDRIAHVILRPRPFVETRTYFGPDRRRRTDGNTGPERRKENLTPPASESDPLRDQLAAAD